MRHAEIVLTGGYSAYPELHGFIEAFALEMCYSCSFTADIHLTLKEAFVNAVMHGNRERSDLPVRCSLSASWHHLHASVRDCGVEFDPGALPDPCSASFFMKLSGRGLHIIRSIADLAVIGHEGEGKSLLLHYDCRRQLSSPVQS
ncbi:MAG: ATP-binding protein [Chlorobiaceae bacterium]|nr:ATP-binding protein [Chlorobiaceae bacterium]NTW10125.1 ATP-binding protein [Chlorobiaceae bacterium]